KTFFNPPWGGGFVFYKKFFLLCGFFEKKKKNHPQNKATKKIFLKNANRGFFFCLGFVVGGWGGDTPENKRWAGATRRPAGQQPQSIIFPVAYSLRYGRLY
ncbi:hypothetical protein, partial [Enterobacter hormaechei]